MIWHIESAFDPLKSKKNLCKKFLEFFQNAKTHRLLRKISNHLQDCATCMSYYRSPHATSQYHACFNFFFVFQNICLLKRTIEVFGYILLQTLFFQVFYSDRGKDLLNIQQNVKYESLVKYSLIYAFFFKKINFQK